MNSVFFSSRMGLAIAAGAMVILSACAEKDVVLPGKRETIRPNDGTEYGSGRSKINESRAIRLPAQKKNAEWAQSPGTEYYRTSNAALRSAPQRVWSTPIGAGDGRRARITADPVVAGGLIYTLDSGARVTGVSPGGGVVWTTNLVPPNDKEEDATGGGMAYSGGVLYVSLGFGTLAALDAKTGTVKWRQKLEATGSGTPVVRDGLVYLVAGDDTGWVIKADTGRIAWQIDARHSISNVLGAPAPALTSKFAVFAFGSGDIVASFRKGGLRRWYASVAGRRGGRAVSRIGDITGAPVVVGDRIYAGNHTGRLVALSVDKGERLWTAQQGALGPVWPVGGSLFAVSDLNQLIRFDAGSGEVIWSVNMPAFVKPKPRKRAEIFAHYGPIVAGGRVIVASNDGFLRFYSPQDGTLTASVAVPDGATTGPVVAGGTLYVVSTSGVLHAYR